VNWGSWLIWGFAGTVVLTTILSASQGWGLTRMNLPYMLGTMLTPNRDRAKVYGNALHLLNGWIFSLVYVAAFHASGWVSVWFGALVGFVHGAFVLAVLMPALPGMHPRMASEVHGPTVARQLEPPGFLGRNYGVRTAAATMLAHVVFGAILGGFYSPH
jgi:hypothetical protein